MVTVSEIVTGVNIVLDRVPIDACPAFLCNGPSAIISVNCAVLAVSNALNGCPTPTPTPIVVTYELVEGSTILIALPTPGLSPIVEPLSGTFVARVECGDPEECQRQYPNTFFVLEITSIEVESPHFMVAGTGYLDVSTLSNPYASLSAHLLIDGQRIGVSGGGTTDSAYLPARFADVEVCGGASNHAVSCDAIRNGTQAGYVLTIFAVPQP